MSDLAWRGVMCCGVVSSPAGLTGCLTLLSRRSVPDSVRLMKGVDITDPTISNVCPPFLALSTMLVQNMTRNHILGTNVDVTALRWTRLRGGLVKHIGLKSKDAGFGLRVEVETVGRRHHRPYHLQRLSLNLKPCILKPQLYEPY